MKSGYKVIDADGHVEDKSIDWRSRLPSEYRQWAPRMLTDGDGAEFHFIEGRYFEPIGRDLMTAYWRRQTRPGTASSPRRYKKPAHRWFNRPGMTDPHQRIPDMDTEGIDVALLFGTTIRAIEPMIENPGFAVALCRTFNDWLAEYCKPYPGRLKGVALLPLQAPDEAAKELRRTVTDLGFVSGMLPFQAQGKALDREFFYPIYEEAQRLDVPLCMHVNTINNPGFNRIEGPALRQVFVYMGMPLAVGCFTLGGVMDVFPRLRVAFMEAGCGWLPHLADRMQGFSELLQPQMQWKKFTPMELLQSGRFHVSIDPEESMVLVVARKISEDCLLYASDYAHHDSICPDSVKAIREREDLSERLKRKILSENAARLFKMRAG